MKTLDRYIVRGFLTSALLWFVVLMSLRVVVDLFINMDEFAKMGKTFGQTLSYIGSYYSYQSLAYFTELGGVIVVAAAAFSLARMNHTNELTAMLASGVSLYRVVWPILICAMILCGLIIIDRELVIPPVAHKLARKRDEVSGAKSFAIWLMDDENAAVWYSLEFNPSEQRMDEPMIIARNQEGREFGRIRGKEARPGSFNGRNGWIVQGAMIDPEESIGQNWGVTPTTEKVYTSLPPAVVRQKLPADGRSVQLSIVDPRYGGMKLEAAGRIDTRTAGIELTEPSFTFAVDGVQLGVILADSAVFEFAGGREGFWQPRPNCCHRVTHFTAIAPARLPSPPIAPASLPPIPPPASSRPLPPHPVGPTWSSSGWRPICRWPQRSIGSVLCLGFARRQGICCR